MKGKTKTLKAKLNTRTEDKTNKENGGKTSLL